MLNRTLRGVAIAGLAMAICSNAENCKEVTVYDGSSNNGNMEQAISTFPESPEWTANWGDFGEMKSPYIRLSGIKNEKADWTGNLAFNTLPVNVRGGSLKMNVRSTQAGKFGVWLTGNSGAGNVSFFTLKANTTHSVDVPIANLLGNGNAAVTKVGIGLFGVPAYQYTTLFIDNIKLSCTGDASNNGTAGNVSAAGSESTGYFFRDVEPGSPARQFASETVPNAKKALSDETRRELRNRTDKKFVLTEREHAQVTAFQNKAPLTAKESRDGWYNSLFVIDRNRLQDSAIASPKNLFLEAGDIAAASNNRSIPLLIADIDYAVKYYTDTTFSTTTLEDYHLLIAGFPVSETRSSKIKIAYDPFFVATTRNTLPSVEICIGSDCKALVPKTETEIEFRSAGTQTVTVKLRSGGESVQQTLKLEVK